MTQGFWTACAIPRTCGADGATIPALSPVWQKNRADGTSIYRCATHAPDHAPVDYAAVDRAIAAIESRRSGEAPVSGDGFTRAADISLFDLGRHASPKPFAEVADDPAVQKATREADR